MPTLLNPPRSVLSIEGLAALARVRAGCAWWEDDAGKLEWPQFAAAVETVRQTCLASGVQPGEVVVTPGDSTAAALVWLLGAAAAGAVVAPLRSERYGEIQNWANFIRIHWQERERRLDPINRGENSEPARGLLTELRGRNHAGLILATGGTTGIPKIVLHDLNVLLATVPVKHGPAKRLLPLMRFDHIGGLDMAFRALAGRHVLVAPPADLTPAAVAATIARHEVDVLPATPSFLNLLLLSEAHSGGALDSLRVVPYGAEAMPAGLLARLRAALPQVEFVQRFGTSETGALPVDDGGEGLMLRSDDPAYAWKILDGELWVRSPARALGYLSGEGRGFDVDGWFRTGDLAETLPDGAIRVLGRREELINVGGEKIFPSEVENVLLAHPQVADCRVGAEPSAVLGQVVIAEIVWRGPEVDAIQVKKILHVHAAGRLTRHKWPAVIRLVASIGTTRNGKKPRLLSA